MPLVQLEEDGNNMKITSLPKQQKRKERSAGKLMQTAELWNEGMKKTAERILDCVNAWCSSSHPLQPESVLSCGHRVSSVAQLCLDLSKCSHIYCKKAVYDEMYKYRRTADLIVHWLLGWNKKLYFFIEIFVEY